jgi:hypothetical protein
MTSAELHAIGGVIRTTYMPHGDKRDLVERLAERLNALDQGFEPGVFATACGLDEPEARVVLARCGN